MTTHTISTFKVTGWEQSSYGDHTEGAQLGRATVKKVFTGDLEAESTAELLLCGADDYTAGAGYVASELVVGQLNGRQGTFVFQHGGLSGGGIEPYTFGHIIPGTGTGELVGLRGKVEIIVTPEGGHTIVLDYDFS
jgi:hypothetical protein